MQKRNDRGFKKAAFTVTFFSVHEYELYYVKIGIDKTSVELQIMNLLFVTFLCPF